MSELFRESHCYYNRLFPVPLEPGILDPQTYGQRSALTKVNILIRKIHMHDISDLCSIYNYYVENTIATFEEVPISEEDMAHRVSVVTRQFPWLVFEEAGRVLGFAYGNYWKPRPAYRHTLESTIYLDQASIRRGIGAALYMALLDQLLLQQGIHRVLACISLPNNSSIGLHERLGFRKVAHFSEVGNKFQRWIDVGYWELAMPYKRPAPFVEG